MLKSITILTAAILAAASGCVSNSNVDSGMPSVDGLASTNGYVVEEYSGKSYISDVSACVENTCVGQMRWSFDSSLTVYNNTKYGFVTAEWNATPTAEELDIFIFSGEYPGDYQIVARDQGPSPRTLAFTRADLDGQDLGARASLGVGFSGNGPVTVADLELRWGAVVISS